MIKCSINLNGNATVKVLELPLHLVEMNIIDWLNVIMKIQRLNVHVLIPRYEKCGFNLNMLRLLRSK